MTVYKAYMKIVKRNVWLILLYLAIFFGVTMMFQTLTKGDEYTNYQAESVKIALVDEDGGTMAESLKSYLEQFHNVTVKKNDVPALQEDLFYRNVEYIVRIPADFFETCVMDGEALKVTKVPGSYTAFYVDQQINSFLNNARTYYAAGFSEEEMAEVLSKTASPEVELLNTSGNAGEIPSFSYYYQYAPYLFLSVLCYVMGNVLSAFRRGDLPKRMNASAVSAFRQNLEGLLAVLTIGAGLWGFVTAASIILYGKTFTENGGFGYYLLNSVMMLLVALALSYLVGIFTKNINALSGIVNVISLGMSFLCGVFVPLELMNKNVIKAAQFLPVYWYEKANGLLTQFGTVTGEVEKAVWQALGIQFVFAVTLVCIAFAVSKVRQEAL